MKRRVDEIRTLVGPDPMGFNQTELSAKGASADVITSQATTLPMMAPYRLIVVRGLSDLPAAELVKLLPYIEDPNPTTVLVLCTFKLDKRIKFFQRVKKLGYLEECGAPKNIRSFLQSEAKRIGATLTDDGLRRLTSLIGDDVSRLVGSLEQLDLYADGPITADHVDELIASTKEQSVFALTDAITRGARRDAQLLVRQLTDQKQSAIGAIALLGRYVSQLGLIAEGKRRGLDSGKIASAAGCPPFVVNKLTTAAMRTSPAAIAFCLSLLSKADISLKGGGGHSKTLGRALTERAILAETVDHLIARLS